MHKFFLAWLHSLGGTFAGHHFHLTWGFAAMLVAACVLWGGSRVVAAERQNAIDIGWLLGIAGLIGAAWLDGQTKPAAPIAAAPRPTTIIRRTTVVQHITNLPGHPVLSGWQIVAVVIGACVVGLVMFLNLANRTRS